MNPPLGLAPTSNISALTLATGIRTTLISSSSTHHVSNFGESVISTSPENMPDHNVYIHCYELIVRHHGIPEDRGPSSGFQLPNQLRIELKIKRSIDGFIVYQNNKHRYDKECPWHVICGSFANVPRRSCSQNVQFN